MYKFCGYDIVDDMEWLLEAFGTGSIKLFWNVTWSWGGGDIIRFLPNVSVIILPSIPRLYVYRGEYYLPWLTPILLIKLLFLLTKLLVLLV